MRLAAAPGLPWHLRLANAFHLIRRVLTVVAAVPLLLVLLMIAGAVLVEGDPLFPPPGDPNIGLGVLVLALLINGPVWLLWLLPPYRRPWRAY